ncbi:MAG: peptidase M49 [Acidobacteria bacterium]|nr:peptidase M49 [Acidobacteriota bacterium]
MSRQYLLEQVDDVAVVQYYADNFAGLPLEQKMLVWHLCQAAIAGRDIYYDQRYRHALDMRAVLEQVLVRCGPETGVDAEVLAEIRRYTKLFWINSGPYNGMTARKFVLRCSPDAFAAAVRAAAMHGAHLPLRAGETIDGMLSRLERPFFDPAFDPMVTSKTPEDGRDVLAASANNLYDGLTVDDLAGFSERYGLNSRLVRTGSGLTEQVYRIGGLYGIQIAAIVDHLRSALAYAPPLTRRALEALIRFYESGEKEDRLAYDIAWVEDRDATIDTVNGFVEVYLDARGVKGAWEGIVYQVNEARTAALARLAGAAAWFEERMPWKPEWRRTDVVGVTARAVDVIVETGDAGPLTAVGINLPNDEHIRELYGSKSVTLSNITEAYDRSELPAFRQEFCWSGEEDSRAERWGTLANEVSTAIHEVLGHGSGRVADRLEGQPQLALKETYSSIEEARADLVALFFMPEPRVAEIGLLPAEHQAEIVRTEYEAYARQALVQLRRAREGTTLEEDHMRNRQLIVHWLLVHTSAIDVRLRDGRTYYVVNDVETFHHGVGRLLAEVQDIKSEGDYARARALVETYGTTFDPGLRDEIVARVDRHHLPSYTAFVQPRLDAIRDDAGQIVDVRISYPQDLERQMLEYSGASS